MSTDLPTIVYAFVQSYIATHHRAPSIREIATGCFMGFYLTSVSPGATFVARATIVIRVYISQKGPFSRDMRCGAFRTQNCVLLSLKTVS